MRSRWPDAKIEGRGAKCDLRNEQQREKREQRREIREQTKESREGRSVPQNEVERRLESLQFKSGSWFRRKNPSRICSRHGLALSASEGGMEESREKREERREKMAAS